MALSPARPAWLRFSWLRSASRLSAGFVVQYLLKRRARAKFDRVAPWIAGRRVLDLGCGEGYVGEQIGRRLAKQVVLADVAPVCRSAPVPFIHCQQGALPFKSGAFDTVLLIFVLHHSQAPLNLLQAACNAAGRRLIVWESLHAHPAQAAMFCFVDRCVNFVRSGGKMGRAVCFFDYAGLRQALERTGFRTLFESRFGSWLHPQAIFVMTSEPAEECRGQAVQ